MPVRDYIDGLEKLLEDNPLLQPELLDIVNSLLEKARRQPKSAILEIVYDPESHLAYHNWISMLGATTDPSMAPWN